MTLDRKVYMYPGNERLLELTDEEAKERGYTSEDLPTFETLILYLLQLQKKLDDLEYYVRQIDGE